MIVYDLKWAQTMDGQLCDDLGKSQWISSLEERVLTHQMRSRYYAVLVGAGTYLADLCELTVRLGVGSDPVRQPLRVIVDPKGSLQDRVLKYDPERRSVLLAHLNQEIRRTYIVGRCGELKQFGLENVSLVDGDIVFGEGFPGQLGALMEVVRTREQMDRLEVLVEGGARFLAEMLKHRLFRKVFVSMSPQMTGGTQHRIPLMKSLSDSVKLETKVVNQVGTDVFMEMEARA